MVNVVIKGLVVVFVNAPEMSPDPLPAIPVTAVVLLLVRLCIVPVELLLNAIVVIVAPEQMVCDKGVADAAGAGFTCAVAVMGAPVHPLSEGVMVNVTVTGAVVVFVNAPLILPEPLPAIPVTAV